MLKFSDKKTFYSFISPPATENKPLFRRNPYFAQEKTILFYLYKDKRYNFFQRVATGSPFFIFAVVIPSTRKKETIPVLMLNNASNSSIIIAQLGRSFRAILHKNRNDRNWFFGNFESFDDVNNT